MAAPQPTSPAAQSPPELPSLEKTETGLVNYLRTFSLWCRNGFRDKLSATTALPGILLTGYDLVTNQPTNVTYLVTVKNGSPPTLVFTQVAAGSGAP